jgi:hypothetical protein
MENIFNINRESNFKNEVVKSVPVGNNNITFNKNDNNDFRKEEINGSKPMLSGNKIFMPDNQKNKKVPLDTFSSIANSKKNINSQTSSDVSGSDGSSSDELLSNNKSEYDEDDDDDDDNYSSIDENVTSNLKKKSHKVSNTSNDDDDDDEDDEDDNDEDDDDDDDETETSEPKKTYEDIQKEKQQLLFELERLQKQGYAPSKRYSMASAIEELKFERDRLKKQRDVEKSINFSRKILLAAVSGIEYLNGAIENPFDIRLKGWSENVMENVSDYDEVFEELHDKYGEKVKMAPELKLLMMVAGSGFMFHLTNSLFKSATPNLNDVLRQNPDIMRNIQEAASKSMTNNINQQFGENDKIGNMMKQGINMKMNSGPTVGPSRPQPKMNGPSGVDELLNELNSGREDMSLSSNDTSNMISSSKRSKRNNKNGIQLTF